MFPLLFGMLVLTSCDSQVKTLPYPSDTPANSSLQAYRQKFWDSLPEPRGWTNDYENIFIDDEEQKLDSVISVFEKETTTQICIVTIDTVCTSEERFDNLALHIGKTWGVGQKEKDNGIVICISTGYRRIRISNGYGIEKILSDEKTKEIIDKYFIPKFKQGEYFQGTFDGLTALISTLREKAK